MLVWFVVLYLCLSIGIGLYELNPHLPYWLSAIGLVLLAVYAWINPLLRNSEAAD